MARSQQPTLIGVIGKVAFYEHPTLGDESPLMRRVADWNDPKGYRLEETPYWDLPDLEDVTDYYSNN